jgi:hypothetical protein
MDNEDKEQEELYDGQFVSSKTLAEYDQETKFWTIITDVQEGRKQEGGEWKFKTITVKAMDTILLKAQETVTKAIYYKLQSLENDLFNLPDGEEDAPVRNVFESSQNTSA